VQHHTVCFSADYPLEFRQLFNEGRLPEDPTVYVNVPSRTDAAMAPEDGESVFVMANAPAADTTWNDETVGEARSRVMARLAASGFPALEERIVAERVITPGDLAEKLAMPGGAIYGGVSHGWRGAFARPANKDQRRPGLYYVGGGTHPGGGTPTVLLSAAITAELIERYEGS
jgi:phytoene desaturase